jgi:type IV pilus assembly protein PilB
MAANPQTALSGLARAMIQHGRLSEADAVACTTAVAGVANAFIHELAQRKIMTHRAVAWFAAETFGYPLLDISTVDRATIPRDAIDKKLMGKHQIIALGKRQNRLTVERFFVVISNRRRALSALLAPNCKDGRCSL